jgi:hypothetical protein
LEKSKQIDLARPAGYTAGMIRLKDGVLGLFLFCLSILALPADDILFFGNSFTQGAGDVWVVGMGGIPKLVEAIAASKGKTVNTMMVATGGKDWAYFMANPATDPALKSKPWNWVVLQDYSTKPTHLARTNTFMADGEAFYDRIAQESPQAKIVLYETWAYDARNPIFTGVSNKKGFVNPDEMIGEIVKNYTALLSALQAKDPNRQIVMAPVGEAFARCVKEHPEIALYNAKDLKHPTQAGSYLSAMVIYATIFQDSPKGALTAFKHFAIDDNVAANLQAVADEVGNGHQPRDRQP